MRGVGEETLIHQTAHGWKRFGKRLGQRRDDVIAVNIERRLVIDEFSDSRIAVQQGGAHGVLDFKQRRHRAFPDA